MNLGYPEHDETLNSKNTNLALGLIILTEHGENENILKTGT